MLDKQGILDGIECIKYTYSFIEDREPLEYVEIIYTIIFIYKGIHLAMYQEEFNYDKSKVIETLAFILEDIERIKEELA